MQARPLVCNACNKTLDPTIQTVVYLGWGARLDSSPGPEIVLALCPTTVEQLHSGTNSPCVATAMMLLTVAKIAPVPATYDDWLASYLRRLQQKSKSKQTLSSPNKNPTLANFCREARKNNLSPEKY